MFHDLQLRSALVYMENRVTRDIDASEVARVAGYDPDYFRGLFRRNTDMSLGRYMRLRRLSNAAFELRNSRASITDIAMKYGFNSHDVFIRAFKREFGMTPSGFRGSRRTVRGDQVIPGVFVPTVMETEDTMEPRKMHAVDSTILYGVPKVTYFKRVDPEITPFISCLRACLTYAGQGISYGRLMAGSGAAFRLMWNTTHWDGGNCDIMVMREDAFEPMRRAFETAGRSWTLLPKDDANDNRSRMIELIRTEIGAGRPLIALGVIGPPEACVVTGYREDGDVLTGWNYFQEMPEWKAGTGFEACGYFNRRGWYEHPETKAVIAVGDQSSQAPDGVGFLKDVLAFGLDVMRTDRVGDFAGGQAAYAAWEKALSDESAFPPGAPLPMLMERLMCQMDAFSVVGEGRHYAGLFLAEMAEGIPGLKGRLLRLAEAFKRSHTAVWEMHGPMGGMGMGEDQARRLAKPETRRELTAIIRKAARFDKEAEELMASLLSEL